jgi:hypothetical protein
MCVTGIHRGHFERLFEQDVSYAGCPSLRHAAYSLPRFFRTARIMQPSATGITR